MAEIVKARITSGPDESVYRQVALEDYTIFTMQAPSVYDAVVRTIDGTEKVYTRRLRKNFGLSIDGLTTAELRVLEQICSDRQEVCFESNIGEDTVIYNTFERSTTPYIGPAATFSRASVATYMDEDGLIKAVASGVPRFEACKLGNGILLEPARTNYLYPSHPASGALVYSSAGGTPTLTWDTSMPSNVDGEDGTLRVEAASGDSVAVAVTFPDATACSTLVWIKGIGTVTLVVTGLAVTKSMGSVVLTGDWQMLYADGGTSSGTTVTVTLGVGENNTRFWVSGSQVENGLTHTSYIPTTVATVTRPVENLSYASSGLNYAQGSIAFWLRWPSTLTGCTNRMLFYISPDCYCQIEDSNAILFRVSAAFAVSATAATHGYTEGDIVHIACVWKDDFVALVLNGVAVDTDTDNQRGAGAPAALQLYHSSNRVAHSIIDDLRVDSKYIEWRTSAGGDYQKYAEDGNLELVTQTQGRLFRIKQMQFQPREGYPDVLDGSLLLSESFSDSDHTVGVA